MRLKVHPVVSHMKAMLASMEARTGKSPDDWATIVLRYGATDVNKAAAQLKADYGLGKPTAWLLASRALGETPEDYDEAAYLSAATDLFNAQFAGKKAELAPIAQALATEATMLGDDAGVSPTKTMVPFYRHHVFAQVKAATQKRVDLCLALKGYDGPIDERLKPTGGSAKGDRITHVIGIFALADIDDQLRKWLKIAYELDEK
ncbi:DUF5655 domain-containing protein [Kordiimonas sp.]|uniref:DUF5655 domain-containing protein n=1 Tax=Kordiimonas sp. TaxID=1970157 RepID=UPI003A8E83DA